MLACTFYSFLYDDERIYAEVQSNRELLPNTVEEMLRYRFHVAKMDRTVKTHNDVLGVPFKKRAMSSSPG
ncbi:hypothetical protein VQ056_12315 [Paenibacillus sp. JTLBN-2024]